MAQVNTDDGLLTQGFFKTKFWGKLLGMFAKYATKDEVNAALGDIESLLAAL